MGNTVTASIGESAAMLTPLSALVFMAVFLICYLILYKSNLPPGPIKLPVIGSGWWLLYQQWQKKRTPVALCEAVAKYGEVMHFRVGTENLVFIHGYDAIQDAFVKHSGDFSARPSRLFKDTRTNGVGLVMESGTPWKILRRYTLQSLKDFGVGKTSLEEKIVAEMDAASVVLISTKQPTDLRLLTSMIITNVIYGIIFGKRYEYEDKKYHELIEKLDTFFHAGSPIDVATLIPTFVYKLLRNKNREEGKENNNNALRWLQGHINGEIEEHEASYNAENTRDFVDLFIHAKYQESDKDLFTLENFFYVIMDLFIAGSETSSNTLNWFILYMQEYPDVQHKCQEEIQEICPNNDPHFWFFYYLPGRYNPIYPEMYISPKYGDRPITWAERGTLPYVEATMMEIQRMSNIAEMSVPHTNEKETVFRGFRIPKDSIINANLISSNMDTKYWDEPELFKPKRFLQDGKIKKNKAFIPFSIGPRSCLGENLVKMELFLICTNFLQQFTFQRENEDDRHTFDSILEQLTCAPVPYKSRIVRRT